MTETLENSEPYQPYTCSFKAPTQAHKQLWLDYKKWIQDHGSDICYVTFSLIESFYKSVQTAQQNGGQADGSTVTVATPTQVFNIQQQNTFLYSVEKPRREPLALNCAKTEFSRTISSAAWEAYVMEKARDLNREFSYRDFLELKHDSFRKIVSRLKKKRKVIANPERTNPRYYILTERLADYPSVPKNTRVRQKSTLDGSP